MRKAMSLNASDTVYVTTNYYGGQIEENVVPRSYNITVIKDGVKCSVEIMENDLFTMLAGRSNAQVILDDGVRPEMIH